MGGGISYHVVEGSSSSDSPLFIEVDSETLRLGFK